MSHGDSVHESNSMQIDVINEGTHSSNILDSLYDLPFFFFFFFEGKRYH